VVCVVDIKQIALEEHPLPLMYIVDVNHDCNLKCKMCVKRTMTRPSGQKPLKDFMTIVDSLPWTREISIGALGDPFLYTNIEYAMKYLYAKKIRMSTTTNGTLITKENIKTIPPNSVIHISIDGGTDAVYKKIRGMELSDVKENVRMLKNLRPDVAITINYLLFNFNLDDAEKMIAFCSTLKIGLIFFYPMYFTKQLEKQWSVFRKEGHEKNLAKLQQMAKDWGVPCYIPPFTMTERPCIRAFQQPIIAYDGTVYPCDYIYQDIERMKKWTSWYLGKGYRVPQEQYAMGNIYKEPFITMWNSKKWRMLRAKLSVLNTRGIGMSFEKAVKTTNIDEPFEYCKICLARWSRCL